jgi:hypothetical protein
MRNLAVEAQIVNTLVNLIDTEGQQFPALHRKYPALVFAKYRHIRAASKCQPHYIVRIAFRNAGYVISGRR